MPYIPLGKKFKDAVSDTTGLNSGNFTNIFDLADIAVRVPVFEVYHVAVTNGFTGVNTLTWYQNTAPWSSLPLFGNAEWDPQQALLMTPQDELYFCWNKAFSGSVTPCRVTIWLRYDPTANPAVF